jgi:hypothetical protein
VNANQCERVVIAILARKLQDIVLVVWIVNPRLLAPQQRDPSGAMAWSMNNFDEIRAGTSP